MSVTSQNTTESDTIIPVRKQAFFTLKETNHNADKATLTEKTKKLNSLFSRNKLKLWALTEVKEN